MDFGEMNQVFAKIKRKGVLIDEHILKENFQDVVNKAFDRDMGFGYISESGYKPKARVILQGKNPFIDNHTVSNDSKLCDCKADTNHISGFAQPNPGRSSSIQPSISSCMGWRGGGWW